MFGPLRARLAIALAMLIWSAIGAGAQVHLRKNIDLLNPTELSAYEHAIQILKDRSAANAFDQTGYLWQAWVHNCAVIWQPVSGVGSHSVQCDNPAAQPPPGFIAVHPGMCEHHKDLFLIWHRAEFYYFEKILQASDPDGRVKDSRGITGPSTRDVTVPFWNWTRKPSGIRYAKALENKNSPLYDEDRISDAVSPDEHLEQVTSALAVAALVYDPDWKNFGGYPQEAPIGGGGLFENQHHDQMHDRYFGGKMRSTSTAALDPGFFSFHAYIDLLLQFWIEKNGVAGITSLNHFLRATQPGSVTPAPGYVQGAGLPSMGQLGIYLDPAKLGYRYEVTDADRLPTPEAVAAALASPGGARARFAETSRSPFARLAGDGLFDPGRGPPTMIADIAVPVPSGAGQVQAVFQRPHDARDDSFSVDFFLHPEAVKLDLGQPSDRAKYIVRTLGRLGSSSMSVHNAQDADKPLFVDLTTPLRDLADTGHAGETWTLTAVVSGQPPSPAFGTLALAQ
jgi:tyrosinase